ncbi:hypothetical protein DE146DRAFT_255102 [Phaeosphaeria sp. MPI-PUGE-AT-0046c]|nr:hypothetical protein DE146DRAFT_255102 [Phaeosphaeria sp. MPI-PUGE-AT-0046c]
MAELAGSIIGIVSAGTKVALVLSQLAADLGSAGQEARMISSEIHTFCTILNTLKDTMEKLETSSYYAHCFDMVQGMTAASVDMFTEVLNAAETLRSMAKGKDRKDGKFSFVNKVEWVVFQKPKIVVLRAAIEAYKSNIALMLGTINIVEKVARRSSLSQTTTTATQDDQEQATLQSLELDCRSSMISLEQAERQYQESLDHTFNGEDPSLEHASHNGSTDAESTVNDEAFLDVNDLQRRLFHMARRDVNSIRSSLKSTLDERESLQARMFQQTQRLSMLMAEDHRRLSQRWSRLLRDDFSLGDTSHHDKQSSSAWQKSTADDQLAMAIFPNHPEKQTTYVDFRNWFLTLPWSLQFEVLKALRSVMRPDRTSTDRSKAAATYSLASKYLSSNANAFQVPDPLEESSRWTREEIPQESTDIIVQAISNQIATQSSGPTFFGSIVVRRGITLKKRNISEMAEGATKLLVREGVGSLDLSDNLLQALPLAFGVYHGLRFLNLQHNQLEVFPAPLLRLPALAALDLRDNKIRCIPSAISSMKGLEVLFLSGNELQGLPFAIGSMDNLKILDYSGNPIVFPAPSVFDILQTNLYSTLPPQLRLISMLKNYLKQYELVGLPNDMHSIVVQAIAGKLPPDVLATCLLSQQVGSNDFDRVAYDRIAIQRSTTIKDAMILLGNGRIATLEETVGVPHEAISPLSRPRININAASDTTTPYSTNQTDGHVYKASPSQSHVDLSYRNSSFENMWTENMRQSNSMKERAMQDKIANRASGDASASSSAHPRPSKSARELNEQHDKRQHTSSTAKNRLTPLPSSLGSSVSRKRFSVLFPSDSFQNFHTETLASNGQTIFSQTIEEEKLGRD